MVMDPKAVDVNSTGLGWIHNLHCCQWQWDGCTDFNEIRRADLCFDESQVVVDICHLVGYVCSIQV